MTQNRIRWTVLAAVIGAVVLAGCSSNQSKTEAPAASSEAAPQAAAPSAEAEHGEAGETIAPAATVDGIWTQIEEEKGRLSAAIRDGQLKDVHHLAFVIRDLVMAMSDKVTAVAPASAGELKGMVEQVKTSATKLDELGDAGNLSGTQAEYAKLETILSSIKAATAAK